MMDTTPKWNEMLIKLNQDKFPPFSFMLADSVDESQLPKLDRGAFSAHKQAQN